MADTADVVVVGGGVNGASIAWALASRGVKRVVLCEKGALASGASGRSSALVRMHYTNETDARLAFASFPIFRHWIELMGGGPPVFTHTGFVNVVSPPYAEHLRKNVDVLRKLGINTVALSPGELRGLEPHANVDDIGAAAYEPESGYANPADTVEGLRRRATDLGAKILQWTPVTRSCAARAGSPAWRPARAGSTPGPSSSPRGRGRRGSAARSGSSSPRASRGSTPSWSRVRRSSRGRT